MSATPDPNYVPDPRRWRILAVLTSSVFMTLIAVTIINVALPSIQENLDATQSQLQWVLSIYALSFGVGLVAAGRAGDIYGRGPLFIAGVAIFTLASVASGFAQDPNTLNLFRAIQGIGSGLLNPQVIGAIQQYFRGAERARAFGVFGIAIGVSTAIGPVLGGFLIQIGGAELGWRLTFFINVPVGAITILLAFLWLPRPLFNKSSDLDRSRPSQSKNLDAIGAILLGLAVFALMLPFVQASEHLAYWLALPASVGIFALWVWWEQRQKRLGKSPMVDLSIFKVPSFANGSLLITLYFMGMTSIWILIALYVQDGLGHTALAAGLIGLPSAIASSLAALWGGRVVTKYGRWVVIGGIYVTLFGLLASIAVVGLRSNNLGSEWWLLVTLTLIGIGQGVIITPNQALTLADVPLQYAGSSGGIMQTGQRVGSSVGIALITALSFAVLAISGWATAIIVGFSGIILVLSVALWVAYRDLSQRRSDS